LAQEYRRTCVCCNSTSIRENEIGIITFNSRAFEEITYRVTVVEKPTYSISPVVVECMRNCTQRCLIPFKNPYRVHTQFETEIISHKLHVFNVLLKHLTFTLSRYNEGHEILFEFTSKEDRQYHATIFVSIVEVKNVIDRWFTVIEKHCWVQKKRIY